MWACQVLLSGVFPAVRHDGTPFALSQRRGDMTWASKVRNLVRCIGARLLIEGDWVRLKQMMNMASWPCSDHLRWMCRANEKHHLPLPHCLPSGEHRACRMRHGTGRAARVVSKSRAESDRVSLQMHGVRLDACVRLWYQPITRLTLSLRALLRLLEVCGDVFFQLELTLRPSTSALSGQ